MMKIAFAAFTVAVLGLSANADMVKFMGGKVSGNPEVLQHLVENPSIPPSVMEAAGMKVYEKDTVRLARDGSKSLSVPPHCTFDPKVLDSVENCSKKLDRLLKNQKKHP